mgnify:CR=1 FL=1
MRQLKSKRRIVLNKEEGYESLHKIPVKKWCAVILDESHGLGAFPKPSKRAKQVKELFTINNPYVVLLSGTPTPESYSQMYHQVYAIKDNPFSKYKNVPLNESTYELCARLKRDLVVEGKEEVILADTGVKLMSKLHQMYSGTVKFESGNSAVLDYSKAEFIRDRFKSNRVGLFYKFKEELNAIKKVFGSDVCDNLEDFDSGKCKHIALQIVSGREGISLRNADFIVFYNIDFSATSYWQARDRMTTKDRKYNKVYWIFSERGIESKIYKAVSNKKDYTISHFRKDLLSLNQ